MKNRTQKYSKTAKMVYNWFNKYCNIYIKNYWEGDIIEQRRRIFKTKNN